jgi:hypothetical protein
MMARTSRSPLSCCSFSCLQVPWRPRPKGPIVGCEGPPYREAWPRRNAAGLTNVTTLRRFADEEMDVAALCKFSREDLVELGLDKKGQQLKLNQKIAKH